MRTTDVEEKGQAAIGAAMTGPAARSGGRALRLAAATALLAATQAWADCSVDTTGIAFGAYDTFHVAPLDGVGSVTVACDSAYTILLGGGSGGVGDRRMQGSRFTLQYNLFVDASRSIVWGDGSSGSSTVAGSAGQHTHTVYGRIPARQNVGGGNYSDSLIISVNF